MTAKQPPEGYSDLQHAIAAYNALMNEIVTESQYYQGKREHPDKVAYLGDIIETAAARRRETDRQADVDE